MSRRILFILLSVYIFTFGISPVLGVPADLAHHWNFDEGPDWHDDVFQAVSQATTAYDSVGAADADPQNMDGLAAFDRATDLPGETDSAMGDDKDPAAGDDDDA